MPMDHSKYPVDWKKISSQKIKSAGDKCELCYAPNRAIVVRNKNLSHPWKYPEADEIDNQEIKKTKIVLTAHHIREENKFDVSKHNLIALCQRCHLRLDLWKHIRNRKARRDGYQEKLPI